MAFDYESLLRSSRGGIARRMEELLEDPVANNPIINTIHGLNDVHDTVATSNGEILAWSSANSDYRVRTVKDIYENVTDGQSAYSTDASGITLRAGKRVKFNDADASAGLSLVGASVMAADVTLSLPATAPTTGQYLYASSSTALNWITPPTDVGFTNPMTTTGDLIKGGTSGTAERLGIGTAGQVLASDGTTPTWTTLPADVGFANPMTSVGDLILGSTAGAASRLAIGPSGKVLKSTGTTATWQDENADVGFANPMTTAGDVIIGAASGVAQRLGLGTSGQVLKSNGATVTWDADIGFANPMTTTGDIIKGGAGGVAERLPVGNSGEVLTSNGVTAAWSALPADVGFANPMTTTGDLIKGGASGTAERLGIGTIGQVLASDGTTPTWMTLPADVGFANPMTTTGDVMYGGVGGAATRLGVNGTAPGNRALLLNSGGTACVWSGYGLHGTNDNATAIALGGGTNTGNAPKTVIIGNYNNTSTAPGAQKICIGYSIGTIGNAESECCIVGNDTAGTGASCTIFGNNATCSNGYGTAIGAASYAGEQCTSIGRVSNALGNNATACGNGAISQSRGTAIGHGATVNYAASNATAACVAIGISSTTSTASHSVAIGASSSATDNSSCAIGCQSSVTAPYSTAIGFSSIASAPQSTAIGYYAQAIGARSMILGDSSKGGADVVVVGSDTNNDATSFATKSIFIGGGIRAYRYNTEALEGAVVVGYHGNRGRKIRGGVTLCGSYAARAADTTSDTGYYIKDSTIIGDGIYKDVSANIQNTVMVGASGKELLGGTIPTTAFNHATAEGTAQASTGDGIVDIYGKIRIWKSDRAGYCLLDYSGGGDTLTVSKYTWNGSAWAVAGTPGSITISS